MHIHANRLLLCRPGGGFNDVLCQIERCWQYAERYNRHLLIDTSKTGILDDFDKYFRIAGNMRTPVTTRLYPDALEQLNHLSAWPKSLTGRISSYTPVYDHDSYAYVDTLSREEITFDFNSDMPQEIIVHNQCGGGDLSIRCLDRLLLEPLVRSFVLSRLAHLPKEYEAIHVRNTDMKTDYHSFFEAVRNRLKGKSVLVCSDDWQCLEYARKSFSSWTVYTTSKLPRLASGIRLHENSMINRFATNLDAIVDLLALAGASELHFTRPYYNNSDGFSGFSMLAMMLRKNEHILNRLIKNNS